MKKMIESGQLKSFSSLSLFSRCERIRKMRSPFRLDRHFNAFVCRKERLYFRPQPISFHQPMVNMQLALLTYQIFCFLFLFLSLPLSHSFACTHTHARTYTLSRALARTHAHTLTLYTDSLLLPSPFLVNALALHNSL